VQINYEDQVHDAHCLMTMLSNKRSFIENA